MDAFHTELCSNLSEALRTWNLTPPDIAPYHLVDFDTYYMCSTHYALHWQIQTFMPPLMVMVGSVGNFLAFVVLTRKNVRGWSVCWYLALLALTNTLGLYMGCGLYWVSQITGTPYVSNLADWVCRVWQFLYNVVIYSTHWLVVAMAIDRFLTVWYPSKAQQLCTVFVAKLVTVIILIGLLVISIHAMWTYELTPHGCFIDTERRDYQSIAWPWISATLYSYVPVLLLMLFMVPLTVGLIHARTRPDCNHQQDNLTKLTLVLAVAFVVMQLPMLIINFIEYNHTEWSRIYAIRVKLYLARVVCSMITCLNHSLSFLLYFLLVPSFRSELGDLLHKLRPRSHVPLSRELTSVEANGELLVRQEEATSATML